MSFELMAKTAYRRGIGNVERQAPATVSTETATTMVDGPILWLMPTALSHLGHCKLCDNCMWHWIV